MVDSLAKHSNQTLKAQASLISPLVDFMMVGGATFLIFPLVYMASSDAAVINSLAGSAFFMSFLINAPHFMHSYQLLYANYFGKIKGDETLLSRLRYLNAGVMAPVLLVLFLLTCIITS